MTIGNFYGPIVILAPIQLMVAALHMNSGISMHDCHEKLKVLLITS